MVQSCHPELLFFSRSVEMIVIKKKRGGFSGVTDINQRAPVIVGAGRRDN